MANKTSNWPNAQQPRVEVGEMRRMVQLMDELRTLPKIDYKDPIAVEERVQLYFQWCITNDFRPTVEGLALAIGTNRMTLWKWQQEGGSRGKIIEGAKQLLSALLEEWSVTGKINPTTAIFLQKNHFGFADQYELAAGPINKLDGVLKSRQEIIRSLPAGVDSPRDSPEDIERLLEDLEST